jgi:hypothetical protein
VPAPPFAAATAPRAIAEAAAGASVVLLARAIPKSVISAFRLASIMMFAGFRSR